MINDVNLNAGRMTDAAARNLVIKSLRKVRAAFRTSDTIGEKVERELDRLIKRKTRINAKSLTTLDDLFKAYQRQVTQMTGPLADAYTITSNF